MRVCAPACLYGCVCKFAPCSERPYMVINQLKPFTKYEFGVSIMMDKRQGTFTRLEVETSEDSQYWVYCCFHSVGLLWWSWLKEWFTAAFTV